MQRRLIMLFCSRCRTETLLERDRAFHWRISDGELAKTKAVFLEKGFIDEDWNLLNWNKRQFLSDSSTERVRRYRKGLKQDETLQTVTRNVTVTAPDTDTDTEQIQKQTKTNTPRGSFILPCWIPRDAWDGWEEMRRKSRYPLTNRARELAVKDLDKLRQDGVDPTDVLNTATLRNYRGLFALNGNGTHYPIKPRAPSDLWMSQGDFTPEQSEKIRAQLAAKRATPS
jgi:hypothetical protein